MGNSLKQQKILDSQMRRAASILAFLQKLSGCSELADFAFVEHDRKVYWVSIERPLRRTPYSALTYLMQTLFDEYKDLSFFILRNRIFTSAELSEMDRGMVRIIAKRVTANVQPVLLHTEIDDLVRELEMIDLRQNSESSVVGPFKHLNAANRLDLFEVASKWKLNIQPIGQRCGIESNEFFSEVKNFLKSLSDLNTRGEVLHDFDRPISSILISKDGELLCFGVNSNSINKSLHAEVAMLQRYFSQKNSLLPEGSRIYVSHRPCRMCAGMIHQMLPSFSNHLAPIVTYFEEVPGPQNHGAPTDPLLKIVPGIVF